MSRIEFDAAQFKRAPVSEERALLEKARAGDEVAAATLLLRYEEGLLQDALVKSQVVLGQSMVTRHLALRALGAPKGRAKSVNVRMFFMGLDAKSKTSVKRDAAGRLALLAAAGVLLSEADAKAALRDRPVKLHRVEAKLVEHVQSQHRGASKEAALGYVRASFPAIPWDKRDEDVEYGW